MGEMSKEPPLASSMRTNAPSTTSSPKPKSIAWSLAPAAVGSVPATVSWCSWQHGLRASESIKLRIDDFDLDTGRLWVKRLKNGLSTSQPLAGDKFRAVKAYLRSRDDRLPYAFLSSQGGPMTRQAWYYLVRQAGDRAGLGAVHPHMLRHTTGHLLADRDTRVLQDWLGHRDIRHTAHYSRTSSKRFEGLWGR
jgi:type 1 fimbriae regulatory protein FimB